MQNDNLRNPRFRYRVIAVSIVYSIVGATLGGVAAALLGGFYVCVLFGTSVGAMAGAYSEAHKSRD